ncbi:MAG: TfoX/Sxy family protein [Pseudomonadota bacterium]
MPFDPGMADQMREDLGELDGLTERKMFGGLCFQLHGHMVCGVHKGGAMFRVGKNAEAEALAVPGAAPLSFTGRKMGGMVEMDAEGFADDAARQRLTTMARAFAESLPPKEAT